MQSFRQKRHQWKADPPMMPDHNRKEKFNANPGIFALRDSKPVLAQAPTGLVPASRIALHQNLAGSICRVASHPGSTGGCFWG
jgi:hypothetical protein